ncbi:MAG: tetratricopeptide (TPR) repeat protein [Marivirga sp.]
MDKKRLNLLINNPKLLSEEDYNELSLLKREFPYMQGILPLIVLSAKKYRKENYKKSLQSAAISTLDRAHLKEVLSSTEFKHEEHVEINRSPSSAKKPVVLIESGIKPLGEPVKHLPDTFFTELYMEMDKLRLSKEAYNNTLKRLEESSTKKTTKTKASTTKKRSARIQKIEDKSTKSSKTKDNATKPSVNDFGQKKTIKKKTRSEPVHQTIIEEIKLREIKAISDAHLMEQINLITSFIEKEPSINKKMLDSSVDAKRVLEDLSKSSTHLSDDVISETLAKLMMKQGRKEKAIDIYKKLIWKFPQKKAYFAGQIKILKKE